MDTEVVTCSVTGTTTTKQNSKKKLKPRHVDMELQNTEIEIKA